MNEFFVKIKFIRGLVIKYNVEFWFNTDLRYEKMAEELPVNEINKWLENNK